MNNFMDIVRSKEEAKARALYEAELSKTHNVIDVLEDARSFVSRHSEPWYYSGQTLLGQMDSVIAAAWQAEYQDYVAKATAQGVKPIYTLEQYKTEARQFSKVTGA